MYAKVLRTSSKYWPLAVPGEQLAPRGRSQGCHTLLAGHVQLYSAAKSPAALYDGMVAGKQVQAGFSAAHKTRHAPCYAAVQMRYQAIAMSRQNDLNACFI